MSRKQISATVFENIEDLVKAVISAPIGIGDAAERGELSAAEFGKKLYLRGIEALRRTRQNVAPVLRVHSENEVEILVVRAAELAGSMGEAVAAPLSRRAHSRVRQVADMPAAGSAGITDQLVRKALAFDHAGKNAVSRRGTADISEANKENFLHASKTSNFADFGKRIFPDKNFIAPFPRIRKNSDSESGLSPRSHNLFHNPIFS